MYCHYPWTTLYLSAAGKARVCCFMSVHEDLGEFSGDANVGAAWNGPPLQSVREHIRDGRVHRACKECVAHKTYEVHASAMNPIRAELGLMNPAVSEPPAAEPPAAPPPAEPDEDEGLLRRFIRRWRAPESDGAGRPA